MVAAAGPVRRRSGCVVVVRGEPTGAARTMIAVTLIGVLTVGLVTRARVLVDVVSATVLRFVVTVVICVVESVEDTVLNVACCRDVSLRLAREMKEGTCGRWACQDYNSYVSICVIYAHISCIYHAYPCVHGLTGHRTCWSDFPGSKGTGLEAEGEASGSGAS